MITCDAELMATLEAARAAAADVVSPADARTVLAQIEQIRAEYGDGTLYALPVIAAAFGLAYRSLQNRIRMSRHSFQGHLPTRDLRKEIPVYVGDWLAACSVNKDTRNYRTWQDPNDAIRALMLAHETARLRNAADGHFAVSQYRLDMLQLGKPFTPFRKAFKHGR